MPLARISLTLSRHFFLSFIAFGRSSGLHPVSSHSCCMYVRAGRPAFAWPYAWVHRSTSLMSSSLLPKQCSACLVRLTCIVFVMGGRWPYSWCLVGCCRQDLFNIALNILYDCIYCQRNHVKRIRNFPAYNQECFKYKKKKNILPHQKIVRINARNKTSMNVFTLEMKRFIRFTWI